MHEVVGLSPTAGKGVRAYLMIAVETLVSRIPLLHWLGKAISWRFLVVATKRSSSTPSVGDS